MILLKDLYGVPILIEEENQELIVVIGHFGTPKKLG
jgi:hypothetical protein